MMDILPVKVVIEIEPTKDSARYVWRWTVFRGETKHGSGTHLHFDHAAQEARQSEAFREAMTD